jgi:mycothiol synthase
MEDLIMSILSRRYRKFDFAAVSKLLIDSYNISQTLQNWSIRHWEGQVYHHSNINRFVEKQNWLWETDGKVIGLVHSEYEGSAFLQLMPSYHDIEAEMLAWAEEHLAISKDAYRSLELWVYEDDERRKNLLEANGFEQQNVFMNQRSRSNGGKLSRIHLAEGYQIRGMRRTRCDCQEMAALLNAAFQRDFHMPEEYANFQTAPHYLPEFDLVAVAPDGTFAANAQLTLVPENNYAEFEPVCTHPEHQRKGLARALMSEGLAMLRALEIHRVYVDTAGDNLAANNLYEQMGLTEIRRCFLWVKRWEDKTLS